MAQTCGTCDKPTNYGIHLCTTCTEHLQQDLAEVDSTIEDLWVTSARMDVGSGSVGKSGHSAPSEPANLHAMDTGRTLAAVLTGWADTLGHPEPHPVKASAVLFARLREVRTHDWAPILKQELRDALNTCRRAMDRATNKVFAGMCPAVVEGQECVTPVYARQGSGEGRCTTCGTTWDVQEWRGRALEAAGHHEGTPAEISRMLSDPVNGYALPQGTIRQWINREKLTPIGTNHLGRPVYQVRKVRNLWKRSPSYGKALVA